MNETVETRAERRGRAQPGTVDALGHRGALDGLRGLSWAAVFLGHAGVLPIPGVADAAMYVFFALSGFLITSVLLEEHRARGRIALTRFFVRRALRLGPALVAFLVIWLGVVAVFGGEPWMTTVPGSGAGTGEPLVVALEGAAGALGYVTNWLSIAHAYSGYVAIGHLWSLAVEEQFYLIWAPLLALCLVRGRRRAAAVAAAGALVSSLEAPVLRHAGQGLWLYMGTDARAAALLLGALIAIARSTGRLEVLERRGVGATVLAASLGAIALITVPLATTGDSASVLKVTLVPLVAALASCSILACIVERPMLGAARLLASPLLAYLGRRSYALYLWHYVWLTWFRSLGLSGVGLALVASLACAECSWRLVERPSLALRTRFAGPVGPPAPAPGSGAFEPEPLERRPLALAAATGGPTRGETLAR